MKKNIVLCLLGLVMGGIASYLYCTKRFEDGVEKVELDVIRENCKSPDDEEIYEEMTDAVIEKMNMEYKSYGRRNVEGVDARLYSKIAKIYGTHGAVNSEPKAITESQFRDEHEYEDYDKVTLLYYNCGTVMDDNDEPMGNVDGIIGINNLSLFGYGSGDKDVLYVRNDKLKIDYEVLKQNSEYESDS